MFYTNGGINTFFAFGFAENDGDGRLLLHQIGGARELALPVVLKDAARPATYPYEAMILAGSIALVDGRLHLLARQAWRASKAHIPAKLIWNRKGYARGDFMPVDYTRKFTIREDVLAPLPSRIDWPKSVLRFAETHGGVFQQILDGSPHTKRCWAYGLVAGYLRAYDLVPDEEQGRPGTFRLGLRLRNDQQEEIQTLYVEASPSARERTALVRRRARADSPVTVLGRIHLPRERDTIRQTWSVLVSDLYESQMTDFIDFDRFVGRAAAEA